MAYATPTTYVTGNLVTAAAWNVIANNTIHAGSLLIAGTALNTYANGAEIWKGVACRAYQDTTTSHATSGSWQTLLFNQESFDTHTIHSTSSNTERFTAPYDGVYVCVCSVLFAGNATGDRAVRVQRGGATFGEQYLTAGNANAKTVTGTWLVYAAAAQNITFDAFQSSGGALNMNQTGVYGIHAAIAWTGKS